MAAEAYKGLKNYVRRKKYSRSTKLTDLEPLVTCVGGRTQHIIENIDLSKTYHVSVFGVGRSRRVGVLLAEGSLRPRPRRPRTAARALRHGGGAVRAELKGGKAVFYYKAKPFSDGVWLSAVTCNQPVDIEVSANGKRIHSVTNIDSSTKFFVPTVRASRYIQSNENNYSYSSSSEEDLPRYVVRVANSKSRAGQGNNIVEVSISTNRQDVFIPELQQNGGDVVQELRPMRTCSSIHVAFLPVKQPSDTLRYCVTAREATERISSHASCFVPDSSATQCSDLPASYQKVITQSLEDLQPGTKYELTVTVVYKNGLPVRYTTLYAYTNLSCN